MDGVLLDSEELTIEAAIEYFKGKGFTVCNQDFFPFFGTGEEGFFGGVAKKYGIPYDNNAEAETIYRKYAEIARGRINPVPGVIDFIASCRSKGLKLAVATSARKLKMDINLELLGFDNNTFDVLVCGSDIVKNKPDPEIFLTASKKMGLEPHDCIVVEDAPSGVKAAKSAGMKCLALLTSFTSEQLNAANWIAKDFEQYPAEIFDS